MCCGGHAESTGGGRDFNRCRRALTFVVSKGGLGGLWVMSHRDYT